MTAQPTPTMIPVKISKALTVASLSIAAAWLTGCESMNNPVESGVSKTSFGQSPDGQPVELYTLRNRKGMEAQICDYGGIVTTLKVPGRDGKLDDVVLGYDNLAGYLKNSPFFGCIVGRYGNRIGGAKFTLDGKTYPLAANNGPNSLHGGIKGFDKAVWAVVKATGNSLEMKYTSPDGEEGFPGKLAVTTTYTVTAEDELRIDYQATTDKPTVLNLTHHSYFNLAGQGTGDVLGHEVFINSDKITPVNKDLVPTGDYASVEGTPLDFRTPTTIGARIDSPDQQMQYGSGYDHNWVISKPANLLGLQARVYEPKTGRVMEVWSTEPGVQFYTGNFLDGTITGKGGAVYQRRAGFCFEPQHYPDSPNKPNFPSVVLRPGQTFKSTIIYRFSTK